MSQTPRSSTKLGMSKSSKYPHIHTNRPLGKAFSCAELRFISGANQPTLKDLLRNMDKEGANSCSLANIKESFV